ncbi:RDD family protein [Streptomyces sp. NPDC057638]|uniref:RDD family protein n=1 Tax=Streptomyces sp. NPDC057638 TaxID=3346190 RepID=UPI0036C8DFF1
MSALVTGDAVVLGVQPARLPSRALALALDMVVVFTVYLLVSLGVAVATASLDEAAARALSIATFVLVLVGGPIAVETLSQGRSLGKLACGLRVVRDDGGPIRFRHALVRGAMGVVEILMSFGVIACIASLASARGRRVGDLFAGTLVIRERVPVRRDAGLPPPPHWLGGRFAELDLSTVPEPLWLAIRQYLTRMGELDAGVSWSLAGRLSGELAERTGAPMPEGMPPAVYLAALVNERQTRDARRAFAGAAGGGEAGTAVGALVGDTGGREVPVTRAATGFVAPSAVPDGATGVDVVGEGNRETGTVGEGQHQPGAAGKPVRGTGFAPPA